MNPDTRISVHCYEGDGHQAREALHLYTHHECPVTVFSPEDSRVTIEAPGVESRYVGIREGSVSVVNIGTGGDRVVSGGPLTNLRQHQQMRALLEYPENFFLLNDADSMCLSAKLPDYLYDEPDVFWSNLVHDPALCNQPGYPEGFPRLGLQPPLFLSRWTIERLLEVHDKIVPNTVIPWIDHYLLQCAVEAKLVWKGFPDCVSSDLDRYPGHLEWAQVQVRHLGRVFVHSAKSEKSWGPLLHARRQFEADYRGVGDRRPNPDTDTTADIAKPGYERMRPAEPPKEEGQLA